MSDIDTFLDGEPSKPAAKQSTPASQIDGFLQDAPAPARGFKGWARDVAATAVKGAIAVPEAAVGLADVATGGRVGKFLENEGGAVGFRPKQAKEIANEWHSDATKEAQRKFQEAEGIGGKFKAAIENPSIIGTAVGESIPPMLAGGVAARGLMAARGALAARGATQAGLGEAAAVKAAEQAAAKFAPYAGAAGEGLTMAGSAAEQIRQETPDGLLTPGQSALAGATGLVGGALGVLDGRVAQKLGIGDVDTMIAQGSKGMADEAGSAAARAAANPLVQQQAMKGIPRRVIEGAISEGFLEELPQSVAEQVFQNLALDKPWYEDVDAAVVMGTLSGAAMGGAAAGYRGFREPSAPEQQPVQPGQPPQQDQQQPAPNPGLDMVRQSYEAQLQALREQEQGEPIVAQTAPPDGAAALAQQRAQAEAERQAAIEASRAVVSPDDEIYQSTGMDQMTPSQRMGLRSGPESGALESAAALAVDAGATAQLQQAAAQAQAQAQATEAAKKVKPAKKKTAQAAEVDPQTGEIASGMAAWSDADLSTAFRGAQSRDVRLQLAKELQRRRAARAETTSASGTEDAGTTQAITAATTGDSLARQAQTVQAGPLQPQAGGQAPAGRAAAGEASAVPAAASPAGGGGVQADGLSDASTQEQIEAKTDEVMRLVVQTGAGGITRELTRALIQQKGMEAADRTIAALTSSLEKRRRDEADYLAKRQAAEERRAAQQAAPGSADAPTGAGSVQAAAAVTAPPPPASTAKLFTDPRTGTAVVVPNKATADAMARSKQLAGKVAVRKATSAEMADKNNSFTGYSEGDPRRTGYVLEMTDVAQPPAPGPSAPKDKQREAALARVNSPKGAFFMSQPKAQAFIKDNGLADTHELRQQNKAWHVVAKAAAPAAPASAPVDSLHNPGKPDPKNSAAMDELDGFKSAIRRHGLPEGTTFSSGKGMASGKWIARAGDTQGNMAATIDEAASSLAQFLQLEKRREENTAAMVALSKKVADKLKRGEQPTDVELRDLFGLDPRHTYVKQSAVGQFLVDYMGVSRNKIRASLGAAAGDVISDGGVKYPVVYPRKLHQVFGTTEAADEAQAGDKQADRFAGNKLFTADKVAAARERMLDEGQAQSPRVILQNRDRSTPSSIAQMRSIAARPDYGRLGFSRDFANGAPVVAGGTIQPAQMGRQDVATASDGRRIPVQYAVVDADSVLASNAVDGTSNPSYGDSNIPAMRAIAGNGRIAGLQAAYQSGNANAYRQELMQDAALHGIAPEVIATMEQPVLVRVMPVEAVTADIGDISNTVGNLDLSAVEQANNDANRVALDALQFAEDGSITPEVVRQFVRAMPQSEQGQLLDTNGQPTRQAVDRLSAAVFAKAYGNDALTRLYSQAQDPEARLVMSALAQVAPKMARLEGAGALDVRDVVAQAAEIAVNARRQGIAIAKAAQQMDMAADPDVGVVLDLFASNSRTVRPVVEALGRMADMAYTEASKPAEDMFGAVPRASRADIINQLRPENERRSQKALEDATGREPAAVDAVGQATEPAGSAALAEAQAGRSAEDAAEQGGLNRPDAPAALELAAQTPAEAAAQQDAQEQAAKAEAAAKRAADAAEKAEDERKRIAQASVRAADRFELGQDPLDSLTGQGSIFDDAPAQSASTAASDDEGRERFTLSIEMFGDVPYRASKPVDAGSGKVVSSRVITAKTKLTAANAERLGLPKDKGTVYAWRVSVIRRANGETYAVIEAMATDNGRSPDGEVLAHFKEVENPEAMERIAPAIVKAAMADWQAAQSQQAPAATELEAQGQQAMFSRSPGTRAAYEARIDALFSGDKPRPQGVRVLDRSDVLALLGQGQGPVHVVESKVEQGRFNHGLSAQDWKKVPEWLESPAAVFDSDTSPGRLVFIAPELVRGSPVRMIIDPRPDGNGVNLLINAYDAERNPFERWERDGLLRYYDKQKAPSVTGSFQPRLAGLPGSRERNKILTEKHLAGYRRANPAAFSFAGARAATADTYALVTAQDRLDAGEDPEAVRRETGWHRGPDGRMRFEISDNEAKVDMALLANLHRGGFAARGIEHVSYRQEPDGTYSLILAPKSPQKTSDFVSMRGIPENLLPSLLPQSALDAIEQNHGEEDLIGPNLDDARRVRAPFQFMGFNALPLDVVMDHPKLFAAYPALREIMVQVDPKLGSGASFAVTDYADGTVRNVISIGNPLAKDVDSALLHEIQHGIQNIEGFATGDSPERLAKTMPDVQAINDAKLLARFMERGESAFDARQRFMRYLKRDPDPVGAYLAERYSPEEIARMPENGMDAYRRSAGEVEARNTQARRTMDDAARRELPPGQTADVADKDVLVTFNGKVMANAPLPANAADTRTAARQASDARLVATQQLVDGIRERWKRSPEIIVARNMQDPQVPQRARDYDAQLKSQGATGEARGFIYQGKVYLLSDELKGPQQIAEVLFHEVLGHYGLRGAFGDSLNSILQQMGTMRRRDVVAKAREYGLFDKDALGGLDKAAASDAQIWAAMSAQQRLEAAEEVLAEMAQTQPELGFVKRAIAVIRNWLRTNVPGFKNLKLTDADIVQAYILPARGYVTRSKETGAQSLERAMRDAGFSRAPAGDQTQTEAFKRWFAGSKVVDAEGKPLVVYHGTGADFSEFRASENGELGAGIYFTNLPDAASKYAERAGSPANVLPVFVSVTNPANQKEVSAARAAVQQMLRDGAIDVEQRGAEMQRLLRNRGYDGVIVRGRSGNMEVVAFRPEQIKSAIGNNGNFDPEDADIAHFGARQRPATGTPTDRAVMDMVREGRGARDILRLIAGTSKSRFNRQVARLLLKTGIDPQVLLAHGAMGGKDGFTFLAKYSRKNNAISLTEGAQAQAEQIILHEMVHAATLAALDRKGLHSLQMRRLFEHVKRRGGAAGQYGMKNVGEFVAEVFTNPEFQRALKAMDAPAGGTIRNAWDGFVRILRSILGLPQSEHSALSRALELGVAVMREDMQLRQRGVVARGGDAQAGVEQAQTEAFKRWFGDSKVVDADGKPLVVYHGTNSDLSAFASDRANYFTADPGAASVYAEGFGAPREGANVSPVYLSIQRPKWMPLTDSAKLTAADLAAIKEEGFDGVFGWTLDTGMGGPTPIAREVGTGQRGMDKIVTEAIPLSPEQIKSAIGNNGNFDPENADINHFGAADLQRVKAGAVEQLHQALSHPGKVSLWDKTVGTMRNLAERAPAFKPVFDAAQRFIDDVSMLANEAADAAPRLLPRVDSWRDLTKKPITAVDNKAIAKPLFEGTLLWARDVDGTPVTTEALNDKYRNEKADRKAQLMLATGKIQEGVLKMWRGLPLERYETLINSRFESTILKPGVVWSAKELQSMFGLNDQQVGLYQEARAAVDRSIDITARADMLRVLGEAYAGMRDAVMEAGTLDDAMALLTETLQQEARDNPDSAARVLALNNEVVKRHEKAKDLMAYGYAPLSRFGRYTVDVVDQAGERQYFGMFESMREANQMAMKMRDTFKGAAVTQGTMSQEAFKLFAGITPESLEQFGEMLGLRGDGNEAKDKAFQAYLQLAKNNHSALKRLIHRKGIDGYSEDVGRVLASFVYSNARLGAGALNAGTMENAIEAIPKEQGELRDVAMALRSYIQDPQEEGQAVRGMLFAQYLGGSVASAFVNMTQPFAVTMPWLSQFGGMKKAGAQLARALKDMARAGTDKGFRYEADLANALKHAEDDGVVSPQEIHQLMAQARGTGSLRVGDGTKMGDARAAASNAWERTKVAWGQPFALAEQFNRRSTFIAAFRMAKEQGRKNPAEFARKAVLETQFLYSKANKGRFMRGAIGGTLMTFKTYSVSYLELLHRMWTQGGPEGKRAVGWAMAMLLLMGGAGGLPFMEDAEDLIDGIAQLMGYNVSAKQWRKQALRDIVGKELADFVEQGVSGLPGAPVDVSGRLGMGNLIPGTGLLLSKQNRERDLLEIAGPAGDLVARGFGGVRKALTGDVSGAVLEVSPTAVRNAAKGIDMAASGIYKDTKGYKVIDTTLDEALAKAIGFQPKPVAEVQEANSFMQRSKSFYIQTSSEIKAQWAKALFDKDDAALQRVRARLDAWNRDNPDQRIVVKMPDVWKRVREMGKDRTQRIADTAPKALRQQMREMAAEVRQPA